jgi:regulator of sigma E protease
MDILQTILAMIVTLGILVTIHEWGHYWVARRCGVKVLRFSVGFGKPLWMRKGVDGTEYVVAAIPLGGYVRMLDEREGEVAESERSMAFNNKPVLQRIAIVAAGPLVNLLFAVFAYWLMFVVGVSAIAPIVGGVKPDSPAAFSNLPVGSEIVTVNDAMVQSWEEVNLQLAAHVGETGNVRIGVKPSISAEPQVYTVSLVDWKVDLEVESPISAIGLIPFRPVVKPVLGQVVENSPADLAGLQVGDLIVSISGAQVSTWGALVDQVQGSAGVPLLFDVQRGGQRFSFEVTPRAEVADDGQSIGKIGAGVSLPEWPESMQRSIQYAPLEAISEAINKTLHMIVLTLDSIWKMIEGVISVKNLSGPITIAKVAGASAASGVEPFISFLAYLSISLGVLNLLPIPVLDGGHLVYYTIELFRGKPVSERIQLIGFKIGMTLLLSLMTLAIVNDVMRL